MRGLPVSFLVRRMRSSRLLLGSFLLTAGVTAALAAALVGFWAQAIPQAVSGRLARSGVMSITVSGQIGAQAAAVDGRAVAREMRAVFGQIPYRLDGALWSDPLGLGPSRPGQTIRLAQAAALARVRRYTVLVRGAWPGPPRPGRPVPAAVPAAVAQRLGLAPAAILTVRDRVTHQRLRLRITGVYRLRNPSALYWGIDVLATSGITVLPPFVTYGPMLVSPAAFAPGALTVGQASWVTLPDPARMGGNLVALAARIDRAEAFLAHTASLGGLQVASAIPPVLASTGRNLVVARSLLTLGALPFLLLAAAALALAGRLLPATVTRSPRCCGPAARRAGSWPRRRSPRPS